MTMQIGSAYRARAPFAPCWGGLTAAAPAEISAPFAAVMKASQDSGSLMIRTDVNVWPLSPKDWSTG